MKQIIALTALIAYGPLALATADFDPRNYESQATPKSTTTTKGSSDATTESGGKTTTTSGTPVTASINPGAQTGKQSQNSGSGANAMAGAMLIASGVPLLPPPTTMQGVALITMGVYALMQAKHDKDAAGQSAATGYASNTNGGDSGTTPQSNSGDTDGSAGMIEGKIKDGQAKLAAAGYKLTEAGLVKPDGTVIPASSFNSASGMAAAGMSPSSIAEAERILAQAEGVTPKVSSVDVAGGGGGGSVDGEGGSSDPSSDGSNGRNPFALGDKDKAGLVAGKTVMFDGEPIGVRGQNIFAMVHNCYQKKRAGNHFIESENDRSAGVRSPASVGTRVAPASVKPAKAPSFAVKPASLKAAQPKNK